MKIILSRKGFDSEYGGIPSPILSDGSLLSFPIPSAVDGYTIGDIAARGIDAGVLARDLSRGRLGASTRIHLDPFLSPVQPAPAGWRPALGQTSAAQSHLAAQGVGPGDCFLFYGWFRQVEETPTGWRYRPGAPHIHQIFGWLVIDEVLPIVTDRMRGLARHPWITTHPHIQRPGHYTDPRNTLYVARPGAAGAGLFSHFHPSLQLTAAGATRSVWSLPAWFWPSATAPPLTYHGNPRRWSADGPDRVRLRSASKGQEFVLDADYYPEAADWLAGLLATRR